ncbi:MAG: HpcH/HpaI aldolase/citrate lyase family protein [Pseudorhodoplanes sp.]
MDNPKNNLKHALAAGKPQIGLWASLSSNYTAEAVAGAGFDWLVVDTEHSPADMENVMGQLQAIARYPTTPIVRVPWSDMVTIKRYLDIGIQSLLIPQINTVDEARQAVAYTRYPPAGVRGVAAATRATGFGRIKNYFKIAHEEICTIVQAETREALDNIETIAAVEGVDCIFIGPGDLHASLGYPGERSHKDVMPMIDDAVRRIVKTGKAPGILADSEENARRWLGLGALVVGVGSDVGLLARAADALAARFKA